MSELDRAIRQLRRLRAFYREARCHARGGHNYERIWLVNDSGDLGISRCPKCGATVFYQFGKLQTKSTTIDQHRLQPGWTNDAKRTR